MEEFIQTVHAAPVGVLTAAAVVFVIALSLFLKRLIGFFITFALFFVVLGSGYTIFNHELVQSYLEDAKTAENKEEKPSNRQIAFEQAQKQIRKTVAKLRDDRQKKTSPKSRQKNSPRQKYQKLPNLRRKLL